MSVYLPQFLCRHKLALAVFTALATLFLWEVLFLDYSLGAFDIILNQPSWKGEFSSGGIHQAILSDSPAAHYPQREFNWGHARLLTNTELNPYIFTGMPWSSQGVGAFITSLPQLFLDVRNAIDWSTWLRLICAGFFMYLLVLELGLSRMAGIFAGIVWTYSLHQIVWLEFPQHLATQLWIPLLFLFNIRILREGFTAASAVALLMVNILFFTSGYMQIVLYTYVTVGLFNTVYVLAHADQGNFWRDVRRWTGVHAVYVGAVALCAAGLYAEAQYISEGLRGAQEWRGRVPAPQLGIDSLLGLVVDFFPRFNEVTQVLTPDYYGGIWRRGYSFDNGNIVETGRYFGILALLFAVAALGAAWRTRHARLVAVFAVVMALLFSMIYRNEFTISALGLIPFAEKGSYSRYITLLTFIGAVFAAYGMHTALGRGWRWLPAALGLVAVYVIGAALQMDEFAFTRLWYPAAAVAAMAALMVLRHFFRLDWKVVGWVVVAATAADLFAAGYSFNTRMENERLFPRNNTIRFLLNDPEPYRVAVISDRPLYHPNILSFYDIPVVEGYMTVLPTAYAEYIKELFPEAHVTTNGILFIFEPNVEALRLMNVKYVLSDKPLERKHDGLEHVMDSNNHAIYRVRDHLPRVFCASDVFHEPDPDRHIQAYANRIGKFAEPAVIAGSGGGVSFRGQCRVDSLEVFTHGLRARIDTDERRYLVIPYAYNQNWQALINGRPAELVRANGYHMALEVPAGASSIRIHYSSPLNRLSAWILLATALGVLLFAWRGRRVPGVLRAALAVVAVVLAVKASMFLPAVRSEKIPEREPLSETLEVLRQGTVRGQREQISGRILAGQPLTMPLGIESRDLVSISLMAGTFHQPRLQHAISVEILDASGNVLVQRRVEGENVGNNSWFTVRFPALEIESELSVRVSSTETRRDRSFVLWLDGDGEVCMQSFYRLESSS
ncbi:MAG TPA: YfhO family protein [Arenicellales bacterium]|nr:YfhO family protein [Arenicellales bacterium]